ncbi:amidophosphoribosyltransferase [Sulfitobacter sp. SK012]|uniref:ComF family protein n=1 Tax=Sulfitobacter sp. SK012 TaxID=1389005 RepID=UPI000E0C8404|nr:ComF family protein [Sulfitobacter sp. SK012]AXI48674.1 amidophosphoribosyltransferase [Sulfitobacter sp. SK012]
MIYPARCLTCGKTVDTDFGLCGSCWRDTSFVGGTICDGCGIQLLGVENNELVRCDACMAEPPPWKQGRSALIYRDTGRKLVLALKHGDRQEIAKPAALWMANAARGIMRDDMIILPIPLHWLRLLKRRYNQSALLAKALSGQSGLPWNPDLLLRSQQTQSLGGLGRAARYQTLENAITVSPGKRHRIVGRPVLLIDDVMTTGATLGAATRACLDAGSGPVRVLTLARAAKDT